jgi:3-oxoacyl-[acyl-carrier-protein] synthase II
MSRRVVITGIGAVSPLASDWPGTWEALLAGRSAIDTISHFDASTFETRIAAEVRWDEAQDGDPSEGALAGRAIRLALAAAAEAFRRAELDPETWRDEGEGFGVFLGCGTGIELATAQVSARYMRAGIESGESVEGPFLEAAREGYDRRRSLWAAPEAPAAALAARYGARGPVRTHLTACAASAQAIGEAFHAISTGEVDRALAGGSHAMVQPDGIMAFSRLGALSTRNDEPASASRPFDATRDGFVMGEGAALLVLETAEAAEARGATVIAEIVGYGVTTDGFRATDPDPAGTHVAEAICKAMRRAGVAPEEVGYINAHGTSTQHNDAIESKAITMALGEHAQGIPVSSIKSMIGHLIAAAGGMECAVTAQCLAEGRVPPTINLREPDVACDLDYVPDGERKVSVEVALSNSFGFGGQNVCLALRRP